MNSMAERIDQYFSFVQQIFIIMTFYSSPFSSSHNEIIDFLGIP